MTFISKPIVPEGTGVGRDAFGRAEPGLPRAFRFGDDVLTVDVVRRSWRSTKTDRGDVYLKRHWFEFTTPDGRKAVVYFDRGTHHAQDRWWLYTLE